MAEKTTVFGFQKIADNRVIQPGDYNSMLDELDSRLAAVVTELGGNISVPGTVTAAGGTLGNLTVSGVVTGNVTGNTAGTHTGNVVGNVSGAATVAATTLTGNISGATVAATAGITGNLTGWINPPDADPHIAGVWWDSAGTLTKSAG